MLSPTTLIFPFLKRTFGLIFLISILFLSNAMTVSLFADSNVKNTFPEKIIGQIQTNRYTITIVSGSKHLTYTIYSQDGNMLAQKLLISDLVAGFPELAETLSTGLAGNDARLMIMD